MKPLSLIAIALAAFLIFLGITSEKASGGLSNAITIAGGLIVGFVVIIWIITFIKERKGK